MKTGWTKSTEFFGKQNQMIYLFQCSQTGAQTSLRDMAHQLSHILDSASFRKISENVKFDQIFPH